MQSDTAVFNGFMADAVVARLLRSTRPKCFGERVPCTPDECRKIALQNINTDAIARHAERLVGQSLTRIDNAAATPTPTSAATAAAGRVRFAMAADTSATGPLIVVAHAQLVCRCDEDEDAGNGTAPFEVDEHRAYPMGSEVATMEFVRQICPDLPLPRVYAYEGPGSKLAEEAGAIYMLVEGAAGETLRDAASNFDQLAVSSLCVSPPRLCLPTPITADTYQSPVQEHIVAQWARVQVQLASLAFDKIGAISVVADKSGPVMGQLPSLLAMQPDRQNRDQPDVGPFSTAFDYFMAVANAAIESPVSGATTPGRRRLGASILREIVARTTLFGAPDRRQMFPLSMDLLPDNVIVDSDFNFVAIAGWGSAQTAPWQANHCPELFASHASLYKRCLADQEKAYRQRPSAGQPLLQGSLADSLDSPASAIYACFCRLGKSVESDAVQLREMVRLGMGWEGQLADLYLQDMETRFC